MNLTEQNLREKKFHNTLQSKSKGRFENIFYKALHNCYEDFFNFLEKNSTNAVMLDYGCGVGQFLSKVIKYKPAKLVGVDISEISIQKAIGSLSKQSSNLDLRVGNCEKTEFDDRTFDIVYGAGILHHLNFSLCLTEIDRILKPKGKFIFIEPLGTNPIINFYRKITPNSRSEDEHPLVKQDFDLIKKKFNKIDVKYYGFFTLIFFPFYFKPVNSFVFKFLNKLDQVLFKINIFKNFAWSVLIIAEKD